MVVFGEETTRQTPYLDRRGHVPALIEENGNVRSERRKLLNVASFDRLRTHGALRYLSAGIAVQSARSDDRSTMSPCRVPGAVCRDALNQRDALTVQSRAAAHIPAYSARLRPQA